MKKILLILAIIHLSTLIIWLPFYRANKMEKVFANYDGPNYIVVSKCWYHKSCIAKNFSLPLPLEYYPAHFPAYPLGIAFLDKFLPGWWAMLITNLLFASLATIVFYLLLINLKIKTAFWLVVVFLFLPARILILRSVGAPEMMFITFCLTSIFFFKKEKYFLSGIFLALAQLTKSPAILLFLSYFIYILTNDKFQIKKWQKKWPIMLGPLSLFPLFFFFKYQTGDFFAYFHSGDNFHLFFPPFQTFVSGRSWLGDFWLEDIIYVYLLGGIAVVQIWKKYKNDIIAIFPTIFYITTLFIAHRDISRYSVPLYPFWIIAFADFLKKKEFKVVFLVLVPALFFYAINFINYNLAPIADWTPYY